MFKRRRHIFRIMSFPQHETLLTLTFESTFSYCHHIKKLLGNFQSGVPAIQAQKDSGNQDTHVKSLTKNKTARASEGITDSFSFQDCFIVRFVWVGKEVLIPRLQASRDSLRLGETGNNCNSHVLDTVCKPFVVLICFFFLVRKKSMVL